MIYLSIDHLLCWTAAVSARWGTWPTASSWVPSCRGYLLAARSAGWTRGGTSPGVREFRETAERFHFHHRWKRGRRRWGPRWDELINHHHYYYQQSWAQVLRLKYKYKYKFDVVPLLSAIIIPSLQKLHLTVASFPLYNESSNPNEITFGKFDILLNRWKSFQCPKMSVTYTGPTSTEGAFVYLADILSAFCIPMGCEGTLIDLPFI